MSLISRMRRQTAVYWQRTGSDRFGKSTFADPVEIDCRWEDGVVEIRKPDETKITFNSTVYVDRAMGVGDYLMLGALETDTNDDPLQESTAHSIQRFSSLPNLRNTETLYTAFL